MMKKLLRFLLFRSPPEPPKKRYHTVEQLYSEFKYVIQANNEHHVWWHPICPFEDAIAWAKEHNCEILVDRVLWDPWMQKWASNGIGGGDYLFFATNDEATALMTALRWS